MPPRPWKVKCSEPSRLRERTFSTYDAASLWAEHAAAATGVEFLVVSRQRTYGVVPMFILDGDRLVPNPVVVGA